MQSPAALDGLVSLHPASEQLPELQRSRKRTKHGVYTSSIDYNSLASVFHLPSNQACEALGVGLTIFKRICRKFGLHRWPYRALKKQGKLMQQGKLACADIEGILALCQQQLPAQQAAVATGAGQPWGATVGSGSELSAEESDGEDRMHAEVAAASWRGQPAPHRPAQLHSSGGSGDGSPSPTGLRRPLPRRATAAAALSMLQGTQSSPGFDMEQWGGGQAAGAAGSQPAAAPPTAASPVPQHPASESKMDALLSAMAAEVAGGAAAAAAAAGSPGQPVPEPMLVPEPSLSQGSGAAGSSEDARLVPHLAQPPPFHGSMGPHQHQASAAAVQQAEAAWQQQQQRAAAAAILARQAGAPVPFQPPFQLLASLLPSQQAQQQQRQQQDILSALLSAFGNVPSSDRQQVALLLKWLADVLDQQAKAAASAALAQRLQQQQQAAMAAAAPVPCQPARAQQQPAAWLGVMQQLGIAQGGDGMPSATAGAASGKGEPALRPSPFICPGAFASNPCHLPPVSAGQLWGSSAPSSLEPPAGRTSSGGGGNLPPLTTTAPSRKSSGGGVSPLTPLPTVAAEQQIKALLAELLTVSGALGSGLQGGSGSTLLS